MHKRYTHQTITIITKKTNEVTNALLSNIRHCTTSIEAKGLYNNEDQTILYKVVNSFQTDEVIKITANVDANAFTNVQNTVNLKGNYYQKHLD